MTIFFNVLGGIHAEQFIKLGPEVFDITDANFKRGLVHITIAFEHQFRRLPQPDVPDEIGNGLPR
jgi:hypothetical protein